MTRLLLIVTGMCVFLSAVLNWARSVLLKADKEELASLSKRNMRWGERALSLVEHPEEYLGLTSLSTELFFLWAGVVILALGTPQMEWTWAAFWVVGFWLLNLWMGEILPRRWNGTRGWLTFSVGILKVFRVLLWPMCAFQQLTLKLGHPRGKNAPLNAYPLISRQALSSYISSTRAQQDGLQQERKMIQRIFNFSETTVREVMIPLIEVQAVDEDSTVLDVVRKVDRFGFSRFPVYRERIDNLVGIVHSFDCLGASSVGEPILPHIRSAPFVPEIMPADELLLMMQRAGDHMALVVDEYGGGVGIVTIEDLLEEIVGEIEDEHDISKVEYQKLSSNQYLISSRMEVEQVNELLGIELPKEDYETLGGFLLKAFRRIPKEGEKLNYKGTRFTIHRADERSIKEVLVALPEASREG